MIPLREIISYLEGLAPKALQESYDNSGLQVGDPGMDITGILVALDVSEEVMLEAEKQKCTKYQQVPIRPKNSQLNRMPGCSSTLISWR